MRSLYGDRWNCKGPEGLPKVWISLVECDVPPERIGSHDDRRAPNKSERVVVTWSTVSLVFESTVRVLYDLLRLVLRGPGWCHRLLRTHTGPPPREVLVSTPVPSDGKVPQKMYVKVYFRKTFLVLSTVETCTGSRFPSIDLVRLAKSLCV